MFNLPFKFRNLDKYSTPKGSVFDRAKEVSISVEGNQILVRVPRHQTSFKSNEAKHPKSPYSYERMIFRTYSTEFVVDESWENNSLMYRAWAFNGDRFTDPLSALSMSLGMAVQAKPKPGVSFFHPRAFEQVVGDYLTNLYSKDAFQGFSIWNAPVNWKSITTLPCIATYLEVAPTPQYNATRSSDKYVFFPLDDQHLVVIKFVPMIRSTTFNAELVNPQPMDDLMYNIINSLRLTLSPAAQAQQAKALEGLDDTSLIKNFPPMKWFTPEQDAEWEECKRINNL